MDLQKFAREIELEDEIRRTLSKLPLIDIQERRHFKPKRLILPALALLVVGGTIITNVDRTEVDSEIPSDLIGWWNSDDERYADRAFRISRSILTLQVPDSGYMEHEILGIRVESDSGTSEYEIEYGGRDGTSLFLRFQYAADGLIRFHNQSGIEWYKGDDLALRDSVRVDSILRVDRRSTLPLELAECIKSVTAKHGGTRPVSCLNRPPS